MEMQNTLETALAVVRAAGFKVTKPKAPRATRVALNCLGLPMSTLYDSNYKMRNKMPRVPYRPSSAADYRNARRIFKQAIEAKHCGDAALVAAILQRNGVV